MSEARLGLLVNGKGTMTDKKREELTDLFNKEVSDKAYTLDPESEFDWYSLTFGWAIGKGLDSTDAREFATYIRYHTELG